MTIVGAASVTFLAVGNSTLQLAARPDMRGRVMSLWAVAFLGTTPIGGPIAGCVSETPAAARACCWAASPASWRRPRARRSSRRAGAPRSAACASGRPERHKRGAAPSSPDVTDERRAHADCQAARMRSDAELLVAARSDAGAFRELYERYAERVYGYHLRRSQDPHAAHDLTAETFAQAWLSRARFRDEARGSAGPWLFGIARHVLLVSVRQRRLERSACERLGVLAAAERAGRARARGRLARRPRRGARAPPRGPAGGDPPARRRRPRLRRGGRAPGDLAPGRARARLARPERPSQALFDPMEMTR